MQPLPTPPLYDFAIGEPFPRRQSISRFRQAGQISIQLTNHSDVKGKLRISGADHKKACSFEFQLPGEPTPLAGPAEFWLAPGESAILPVLITTPPSPTIGLGKSVYDFTITATLLAGPRTSRSVLGQVAKSPLIGPWLVSLAAVGLIILSLAGAQAILSYFDSPPTPRQTVAAAADESEDTLALLYNTELDVPEIPNQTRPKPRAEMSYEEIFQEVGPQYNLDWRLLAELAYQESRMNHLAMGRDRDMGLMQIIPSTWAEWAPKVGVSDPYDPYSNVLVAAAYLAYVRDYAGRRGYQGDYWMLIGYNWGPNNMRQVFDNGAVQIPQRQHRYALDILRAFASGSARWKQVNSP